MKNKMFLTICVYQDNYTSNEMFFIICTYLDHYNLGSTEWNQMFLTICALIPDAEVQML